MTTHADAQAVIEAALAAQATDEDVLLITVAATWGSSPRPPGSMLAIIAPHSDAPRLVGSVSGGCVEEDLRRRLAAAPLPDRPKQIRYGGAEAERVGLPCGGTLLLVVESLVDATRLAPAQAALARRESVTRLLDLRTGDVRWQPDHPAVRLTDNSFICPFGPVWHLLLIGAGPVAGHLARIALALEFDVTLCDARLEAVRDWQRQFPDLVDAVTLAPGSPDVALEALTVDTRTAVVALAHDPRQDDLGLMVALERPAFYIAALGSLRTSTARRERLQSLGLDTRRLMAPAGLDIGSHTPAEIAVSIAAELVAAKQTSRSAPLARLSIESLAKRGDDDADHRPVRHAPTPTNR